MSASRRPAFDVISHSPDQTRAIAAHLGRLLPRGSVLLLSGGVGAGKTTFVQGLARPLRIDDYIQSPTFTIVAEHEGTDTQGERVYLYHIDLYRLEEGGDVESIGLDEYLGDPGAITVIEWPERARQAMPESYLLVDLQYVAHSKRNVRMTPVGDGYSDVIKRLRAEVTGQRG